MRSRLVLPILLALTLLTGCGDGEELPSIATATSEGASTPTTSPSASPTAIATRTETPTATPTHAPTGTPTPEATETQTSTPPATSTPSPTAPSTATSAPTATPSPTSSVPEIRATHLRIPKLGIDAAVQGSQIVPYTGTVPAGCPAPTATTTLTVPSQGIATPEETWEGIERKSWIYGHSRWQGTPGLFFTLPSLTVGDELFVDGIDRVTGESVSNHRFVVEGLYLSDTDSGGVLVNAGSPEEIPSRAQVILQTSVRERGEGKAWILDRDTVTAKAQTIVEGDVDDPCKYLLLFVVASAA